MQFASSTPAVSGQQSPSSIRPLMQGTIPSRTRSKTTLSASTTLGSGVRISSSCLRSSLGLPNGSSTTSYSRSRADGMVEVTASPRRVSLPDDRCAGDDATENRTIGPVKTEHIARPTARPGLHLRFARPRRGSRSLTTVTLVAPYTSAHHLLHGRLSLLLS
jgi:hypothetical protein